MFAGPAMNRDSPGPAATAPTARLLVVDDEVLQMKALCETLRDRGYETVGVVAGDAALAALNEGRFDLLLTDLTMPAMDGISLLKAALAKDADLVGIVMTGQGTIETAVEAMKVGAFDYILKPFKVSAILPVLSRALAIRQLRLENAALQRNLMERTAALEAANEDLDLFAGKIAHDLAAPARHVKSFAQLLSEDCGPELSPTGQRYVRSITDAGERMGRLIKDLLTFSRLSRGDLCRQTVALRALADSVWEELKQQREALESDERLRRIVWKISDLPTVRGDESMLRQVFLNLLSNAVKFSRGRTPAEIEVGCRGPEAGDVVLYVRDNGAGFNRRQTENLFGMFQRMHSAEQFEGNGIGLAHVRRILQRHGGRIWAESEVGQGATFYFTLPA
jgi:hypothetical protein